MRHVSDEPRIQPSDQPAGQPSNQPTDQHGAHHGTQAEQGGQQAGYAARLAAVTARIEDAARAAGREAGDVQLLPVSKTHPSAALRQAWLAGASRLGSFGENRVQEALAKSRDLADLPVRWSVIGHLQTNKVKDLVTFASELQSLDSLHLAQALDRRLQAAGRGLDVYVQVNSSGEASKTGLPPEEVLAFLAGLRACSSLRVRGLMTIAAHTTDTEEVRRCFRLTRELRDQALQDGTVGEGLLSMGMSGDLELAVAEGSTCVRVGTAIFGARDYTR